MPKRKTRKQKAQEYDEKYSHIPINYQERLSYLYDTLHITDLDGWRILEKRSLILNNLRYYSFNIILFEVPEGSPRPRFRLVNRSNISNMAISNPNFIHVYSLTGHEDSVFMKRLISEGELKELDKLIYTPCRVDISAYMKTPASYSRDQIILAEIGLDRPISKPDFDNIAKKYCDMFNQNVWLDDALVIDGSVHKYYSILPRIEIKIDYLNMLYNRQQYNSMANRIQDFNDIPTYYQYGV